MKEKIIFLIIGILIGAIITTAGFLIYNSSKSSDVRQPKMMQMDGNTLTDGERPNENNGEEPPAKPDGDDGENLTEKTEESNDNTNS